MERNLGQAVRARRIELGLTQEELADRVANMGDESMRQSDISRIERGQVQLPRLERIQLIARALEMQLGELLIEAGWLNAERLHATAGGEAQSNRELPGAEPDRQSSSQAREAHGQAVNSAYQHLVEALGNTAARHEEFERRRAEFDEMVRQFEQARDEFKRKQEE